MTKNFKAEKTLATGDVQKVGLNVVIIVPVDVLLLLLLQSNARPQSQAALYGINIWNLAGKTQDIPGNVNSSVTDLVRILGSIHTDPAILVSNIQDSNK